MAADIPPGAGVRQTREQRERIERYEARRRWAKQKLEDISAKAAPLDSAGAKPKKAKRSKARGSRKSVLIEAAERTMVAQLITPEAQANGDYRTVDFKLQEVTEGGKRKEKTIRVVRNIGGSPIERWHANGAFDERQMAAILFFQEAHRRAFGEGPRTTANYSPVIIRGLRASTELYAGSALSAKESLRLLDQEVFFREPVDYGHVWLNVVIWEKPAGIAGACAGFIVKKAAEARAKTIVQGIAWKIADIVLDQSRRDFGDLIIDLDAPRRPGRKA